MWVGGAQDGHACIAVADTREWEVHGATNLVHAVNSFALVGNSSNTELRVS